ncbi:MAG TPA: ABC transporter permease [Stellaceae bacterium]|jgi:sulfonate transport system permease protein|nr:ABC transporter permease [Stellaceae bacterium]
MTIDAGWLSRTAGEGFVGRFLGRPALRSILLGSVVPLLILALWEVTARLVWIRATLLPSPWAVVMTLFDLARRGELWGHIEITLVRVLFGFLGGAAAATVCGALTGYSRLWRQLLDPMLQALRAIPSIAWVPLFILWLGIFEAAKVTLIAVGVFFPVYLNLMAGIADVDRRLVEVGRVYGFSPWALTRRILIPATLPAYITGLRGGLGLGWMFVVAAEIMGASEGLGFLLIDGEQTGRPATIIASILLFAVLGKLTDMALAQLGRRALVWQDTFGNNGGGHSGDGNARDQRALQTI